ncbi:MAG: hypothetical protein BWY09_01390 [Candidatus Hydrogenedentes bacterium ADurb.Bin179]|nr:MAG: hypothetical protein BWY09_01390 [Candidatus Hydrogenedentes bacterium ADurb.Bin179]
MRTRIQKRGNGLVVQIPEDIAAGFGLSEDLWIELRSQPGEI